MLASDYDVVYQESRKIAHADVMSSLQCQTNEADELESTKHYSEVNFATCKSISINDLKDNYLTYPLILELVKRIISGNWSDCSLQEMPFKNQKTGIFPNYRE